MDPGDNKFDDGDGVHSATDVNLVDVGENKSLDDILLEDVNS